VRLLQISRGYNSRVAVGCGLLFGRYTRAHPHPTPLLPPQEYHNQNKKQKI